VEPDDWDDTWEVDLCDLPLQTLKIVDEKRCFYPHLGLAFMLESHFSETEVANSLFVKVPTLHAVTLDKRASQVPFADFLTMPEQSAEALRLSPEDVVPSIGQRRLMDRIYSVPQGEPPFRTPSKPPELKSL
jgi:hypothetical protein